MGPLSIAVDTQVKTSVPMFAEKVYIPFRLVDIAEKANEKGKTISFVWDLLEPAPSTDAEHPIKPGAFGSKFFDNVALYDKNTPPGEVPQQAVKKISLRQDGILGTGDPDNKKGKTPRPPFNDETARAMLGQVALLQFKVKTGEFEGNEITGIMFPGDKPSA